MSGTFLLTKHNFKSTMRLNFIFIIAIIIVALVVMFGPAQVSMSTVAMIIAATFGSYFVSGILISLYRKLTHMKNGRK